MDKYLQQLLEDIETMISERWNECPPHFYLSGVTAPYLTPPEGWVHTQDKMTKEVYSKEQTEEHFGEKMAETEQYAQDTPSQNMYEAFGLDQAQLPPEERLTDEQLRRLMLGLLRLWATFNMSVSLPDIVPDRVIYRVLLQRMSEPVTVMERGHTEIELCDDNPEKCPFGSEYCSCKIRQEERAKNERAAQARFNEFLKDLDAFTSVSKFAEPYRLVGVSREEQEAARMTMAEFFGIEMDRLEQRLYLSERHLKEFCDLVLSLLIMDGVMWAWSSKVSVGDCYVGLSTLLGERVLVSETHKRLGLVLPMSVKDWENLGMLF